TRSKRDWSSDVCSSDLLAPVPPLKVGDEAKVLGVSPSQHFTEPPPRFSEASLVKELERLGIGRPSTYSSIVSTLRNREYVMVKRSEERRVGKEWRARRW